MRSIDRGVSGPSTPTAAVMRRDCFKKARIVVEEQPKKRAMITCPPLNLQVPEYALKHGGQVKDIEWSFGTAYGIVDYTRVFLETHENRGVAVTRDTVEKFWVEAVKTQFKDSKREKLSHLRQVRASGTRS